MPQAIERLLATPMMRPVLPLRSMDEDLSFRGTRGSVTARFRSALRYQPRVRARKARGSEIATEEASPHPAFPKAVQFIEVLRVAGARFVRCSLGFERALPERPGVWYRKRPG